ncbi:hypothetical protein [Kaistella soli]|nr:hypothetical protein [Kaistella soli]
MFCVLPVEDIGIEPTTFPKAFGTLQPDFAHCPIMKQELIYA